MCINLSGDGYSRLASFGGGFGSEELNGVLVIKKSSLSDVTLVPASLALSYINLPCVAWTCLALALQ